jgi:alpha-glucosidase
MAPSIPGLLKSVLCSLAVQAGLILAGFPGVAVATAADDPVADPAAIVTSGDVRFTVLTPQMIRMEWCRDARFEDHASLVFLNRKLPVPTFTTSATGDTLVIKTTALELRYQKNSGRFTVANLTVALQVGGKPVVWQPGTPDTGNLKGTTRTLDGVNGSTRLEAGLLSRDGWTVVDDSAHLLFDHADWPWVMARPVGDRQDLYFLGYGHDYRQALGDFTRVAGKIPLPPRFVFGSWWSRYWAYTDTELMNLVADFHAHDLPLDVLVIDMDWHLTFPEKKGVNDDSGHSLGWTGYTWNRSYFPEPEKFLSWAHAQGLKTTVNLHPASGVQPFEEPYPEMARAMGIDPATRQYVKFDIVNPRFAENYFKVLHHPLEKQGIDFFWLDWQQEETTGLAGLNPTFWLNYVHSTDMERRGKRPLIYHRWGGLGNHRYQIGFSGDTVSTWESLAFQPYFTATAANVGYGYWSHDIGGHMPGKVDPEMYTRWVQFGAFSPILRTHSTKNPEAERRIWAYPIKYYDAMRQAVLRRYAMIPYLYTAAREAYDTGISLMRPMYYDYPEAAEAYQYPGQYMFGDSMMVAPVTAPLDPLHQLSKKAVWIPEGEWVEWSTGARFRGPQAIERNYTLDEVPVFLKAGAIVPMQPPMKFSNEKPVDPLILTVFPGGAASTRLYEDAGNSLGYKNHEAAWTTIGTETPDATTLLVRVKPVEGSFPGMPTQRGYEVRLFEAWPPESVSFNGQTIAYNADPDAPAGWRYDGDVLTTVIRLPETPVSTEVVLTVKISSEKAARLALLDGAVGRMARIRRLFKDVNNTGPDSLLRLATACRRIELKPELALSELAGYKAAREAMEKDLNRTADNAWSLLWTLQVSEAVNKVDTD